MLTEEILNAVDGIDSNTTVVNGIPVSVCDHVYDYDEVVTQTLYAGAGGGMFKRTGVKEISYERWVDTNWFDWHHVGDDA